MGTENTQEDSNQQANVPEGEETDLVKHLRDQIKERDQMLSETQKRAVNAEKANAFQSVGIDPNSGVGRLFYENYDGDTTPDAVRQAAEEYQIPLDTDPAGSGGGTDAATQQQNEADAAANAAIDRAAAGATPADSETTDPTEVGWNAHGRVMEETGNREAAMAAHFNAKVDAAMKGNK